MTGQPPRRAQQDPAEEPPTHLTRRGALIALGGMAAGLALAGPSAGPTPPPGEGAAARGPALNVADFGATGNGRTDDHAGFQRAFAALGARGGQVWVPPGTYRVGSRLDVPFNVLVVGASAQASRIYADPGAGNLVGLSFGNPSAGAGRAQELHGGAMHLGVAGPGPSVANSVGVRVVQGSFCYLQDVLVTDCQQGFRLDGGNGFTASTMLIGPLTSNVKYGLYVTAGPGSKVTDIHLFGGYLWGSEPSIAGGAGLYADAMFSSQLHSLSVEHFHYGVLLTGRTQYNSFHGTRVEKSGSANGTTSYVVSGSGAVANSFVTPFDADVTTTNVTYAEGATGHVYPL